MQNERCEGTRDFVAIAAVWMSWTIINEMDLLCSCNWNAENGTARSSINYPGLGSSFPVQVENYFHLTWKLMSTILSTGSLLAAALLECAMLPCATRSISISVSSEDSFRAGSFEL